MRTQIRFLATALVALFAIAACGGDGSDDIVVADLEGTWDASSLSITANDNPDQSVDLVAMGGAMEMTINEDGAVEGPLSLPAAFGGSEIPFAGQLEIIDQETIAITFTPEIPPMLINRRGSFTLEGDTLTMNDEDSPFDFGDGNEVSAKSQVVLELRS